MVSSDHSEAAMHDFETFRRADVPSGPPLVTLQSRGTLSLNHGAFLALGSPDAVELLFDDGAQIIGLRPADPRAPHTYALRRPPRSAKGPFVISAMAFTRHYDIDTETSRRWRATLDGGVLCIDLKGRSTVVATQRHEERGA